MNKFLTFIWILAASLVTGSSFSQKYLSEIVNPFIGTGGHGHTFPGATAPFGMVQLSPDTRIDGSWDGCSGYHYSDSVIYGFSHTHLSGTGVSDYGDFALMPTYNIQKDYQPKDYASKFDHTSETAHAGYYSVFLKNSQIKTELTASKRVGFHRYTFNQSGLVRFIMDFTHRDEALEASIEPINATTFKLTRRSKAWAQNQHAYAFLQFDHPVILDVLRGTKVGNTYTGKDLLVAFEKNSKKGEVLQVKLSYSFTSTDGAELNMTEVPDWDFEKTLQQTQQLWQDELSKIKIKTEDKNKRTIFYTALYHSMIQPNIAEDIDGKYLGRDFKIHIANDFDYYTVFSLWDTFRAAHPLYTLIDEKRTRDFVMTFLTQYQQGGRLPVWELSSNETDCMIGYNAVPVIALAMAKGIQFDYNLALEACMHSANRKELGLKAFNSKNFIAVDDESESVSKTLEYAYDDYCIAQMAKMLGKNDIYLDFSKRSQSWKNMLDPETHLMRPRYNGGWLTPFDGREVNNNYTEANAWQYSFFVPQQIDEFIKAHGGKQEMEKFLDEFFTLPSKTTGREQVDITGLIGQYAHGNEPSHHITYLYDYVDKPEKTIFYVHKILEEFYTNSPDGLIGNEDCGQMSAWYVLSAMGIYAVTPNFPIWATTQPYFDEIDVRFEDGKTEKITKTSTSDELKNFGFSEFRPNDQNPVPFTESPYVVDNTMSFERQKKIELRAFSPSDEIFYSFDNVLFVKYEMPFLILESKKLYFYALRNGVKSGVNTAKFVKKPNDFSIRLLSKYNPQYNAGGAKGLIDGIFGDKDWKKGNWQGYQSDSLVAVIDMKTTREVDSLGLHYLQDSRSWILFPKEIKFYGSNDGKNFSLLGKINPPQDPFKYDVVTGDVIIYCKGKYRYVKVVANTFGELPEKHQGQGNQAFIFVDEILF